MERVTVRNSIPGVIYQSAERLQSYVSAGILTDETLVSAFRDAVRRFPERTALSEVGWSCTYGELDVITNKAASAFMRLELAPRDRVIFQLPNSKELVIAFLGCLKAGLIPICTLAAHRQIEIGYLGAHAKARAHIVQAGDPKFDYVAFAKEMRAQIPTLAVTIVTKAAASDLDGSTPSLTHIIEAEDADEAARRVAAVSHDPFQVALFQLSGGTTDVPKIIPRFHNEYLYTLRSVAGFHGLDETIVAYTPNPMMHNAPMSCCWGLAIFFGGEVAISAGLEPAAVGPLLQERKPNWFILPPVVLLRLQEAGWLDRVSFAHVKGFAATSGVERFSSFVGGAPTWAMFGMTEGLLAFCNASDPIAARHGTVGRPVSPYDEVRILNPVSEEGVGEGEVGELAVRGPCTIAGYFDAAERNSAAFTQDGFYRSGDLMRTRMIDGRRYLIFEGRLKDVVSRGGEKINCEEVERIAINHPSIAAIAVVAMPDRSYGERACAFVIPTAGNTVTVSDLGKFLEQKGLAKFKWPERIELVSEFPLTSSGKLSKPKLREKISQMVAAEQAGQPEARLQAV